jgi:hypothetical protein
MISAGLGASVVRVTGTVAMPIDAGLSWSRAPAATTATS